MKTRDIFYDEKESLLNDSWLDSSLWILSSLRKTAWSLYKTRQQTSAQIYQVLQTM